MRRGGRLFLLLGVVIAAAAAFLLVFLMQTGPSQDPGTPVGPPTEVPERDVVVARIDIEAGTVLSDTETYLDFDTIPEADYNASPDQYFTSFDQLRNKVTIQQISATRPILNSELVDTGLSLRIPTPEAGGSTLKIFPIQVNGLTGVADQVTVGDFVDVLGSFQINQTILRPGVNEAGDIVLREQEFPGQSTKTLVQNVQVVQILRPELATEGTPTPASEPAPPATDENGQPLVDGTAGPQISAANTLTPGNWVLLLAVTDQEAEVIKYSLERSNGITLVLRGRDDRSEETTTGVTLDILISQFGLPLPNPQLLVTPVPTTVAPPPVP